MDGGGAHGQDARSGAPVTPELLADLQAGLLDDASAAALRRRLRTDPDAARTLAALDRVRRDLAQLATGNTAGTAPAEDPPPEVTSRITSALRAARHPRPRWQRIGAIAGVAASVLGGAVGAVMLVQAPGSAPTATVTAERMTVARSGPAVPLADAQIVALLTVEPDFGALTDPRRRASCLHGLGYPVSTPVLGARPVDMTGRPAVLLVLPAGTPDQITALVVEPTCSSVDTGLLADTVLPRP